MTDKFKPWRAISIFVSSTFIDMDLERDYLRDIILKELQEKYEPLRVNIQLIDLRWGISTQHITSEDEREQTILQVCLDEINRSKPFFISLLGDRYGWIPDRNITDRIRFMEEDGVTNSDIAEVSVTEIEILFGALCKHELLEHSLFFFRNPDSYRRLPMERRGDFQDEYADLPYEQKQERINKLTALKGKIIQTCTKNNLPENIIDYTLEWNNGSFTRLEEWGELLKQQLTRKIDGYLETVEDSTGESGMKEIESLDYFIEYNANAFVGRAEELEYLTSVAFREQVLVYGESGIGKSALMCKLYYQLSRSVGEDTLILFYSAGISSYAQSVHFIAELWRRQVYKWLEILDIPDSGSMIELLRLMMLQVRARGKRVLLMIDALDRFLQDNDARFLPFLPDELPVIISTLPEGVESLKLQHPSFQTYRICPFGAEDARALVMNKLKNSHKSLPGEVLTALLDKRDTEAHAHRTPLWLILATDMLVSLDENDFRHIRGKGGADVEQRMISYMEERIAQMPGEAWALFMHMLERAGKYFGEKYMDDLIKYIVFSNGGLRETDLSRLLEEDGWSALKFAQCRRLFKFLIMQNSHSGQWFVSHNILKEQVRNKFYHDRKNIHKGLADYFLGVDAEDQVRGDELTTHLMEADDKSAFISEKAKVNFLLFQHKFLEDPSYWAQWTRDMLMLLIHNGGESPFDYIHDLGFFLRQYRLHQQGVVIYEAIDKHYAELLKTDENSVPYDYYLLLQQFGYCYQGLGQYAMAADALQRSMDWHCQMMRRHSDHSLHSRIIGYLDIAGLYFQAEDYDKALKVSWDCLHNIEEYEADWGFNHHVREEPFRCRLLRANLYYEKQNIYACYNELLCANIAFARNLSFNDNMWDLFRLLWRWAWVYPGIENGEEKHRVVVEKICQLLGEERIKKNTEHISYLYLTTLFMLNDIYAKKGESEKLDAIRAELFPLAKQYVNKKEYREVESWLGRLLQSGAVEPVGIHKRVLDYFHYDIRSVEVLPEKGCVENSAIVFFEEGRNWMRMQEFDMAGWRFKRLARILDRRINKYEPKDYNIEFTSLCNYLLCLFVEDERTAWIRCVESLTPDDRSDSDIQDIVGICSEHFDDPRQDKIQLLEAYFKGDAGYGL